MKNQYEVKKSNNKQAITELVKKRLNNREAMKELQRDLYQIESYLIKELLEVGQLDCLKINFNILNRLYG